MGRHRHPQSSAQRSRAGSTRTPASSRAPGAGCGSRTRLGPLQGGRRTQRLPAQSPRRGSHPVDPHTKGVVVLTNKGRSHAPAVAGRCAAQTPRFGAASDRVRLSRLSVVDPAGVAPAGVACKATPHPHARALVELAGIEPAHTGSTRSSVPHCGAFATTRAAYGSRRLSLQPRRGPAGNRTRTLYLPSREATFRTSPRVRSAAIGTAHPTLVDPRGIAPRPRRCERRVQPSARARSRPGGNRTPIASFGGSLAASAPT